MKKLLLIPIIATSLLTTGCDFQKAPKVSLEKWLTDIEEDAFTYFNIKDDSKYEKSSYRDYEYKVADIIKNNISSKRLAKVTPNVEGDNFVYNLNREIDDYVSMFLLVYENCIIMQTYGKSEDERFDEHVEYAISEKDSKAIFEGVNARFKEMDDIYKATNAKAEEETTLENYYAELDKEKEKTTLCYGDKKVEDASLSLLEDIKGLEYSETEQDYEINYTDRVSYGVNDNYVMVIGKTINQYYYAAKLYKYFYNPANPFYKQFSNACVKTYLVSSDKASAFMEKAKAL